jgi:hypothetical protein
MTRAARRDAYLVAPGSTHAYRDFQQMEIDAFYYLLLERRGPLCGPLSRAGFKRPALG